MTTPSRSLPSPFYEQARNAFPPGHPERIRLAAECSLRGGGAREWLTLGFEHLAAHEFSKGHSALHESLKRDSQLLAAHWLRFQYPLSPAPWDAEQAQLFRRQWSAGLASFEALDFRHPHLRSQIWGCVGSCTAFFRHYLDDNLVEEQRRYGRLLHRMMAALDKGDPPRNVRLRRRRVLVCSAHLYQHTVSRLFLPLVEALDPGEFDLHFTYLGTVQDPMTERAKAAGTFHSGPREAFSWRSLIKDLAPDVIVYLELGMNPTALGLAALRLAPIQCSLWGHPVTSGLPTIDYALTPEAFEPANAEQHYTERLVLLPGLGHGLDEPEGQDHRDIDQDKTPTDFLCAQSIFKLQPEQDEIFARILARVPQAKLHLIPHQEEAVRRWLLSRMRVQLSKHGVDADQRLVLHPYSSLGQFLNLADRCAVNLDSLGWSGGMTAIDLLRRGIPTVAMAGDTMRTRQTAVLLTQAGWPELIARDTDEYVEKAVALATGSAYAERIRRHLREHTSLAGKRPSVVQALSEFLRSCSPLRSVQP